MMQSANKSYNGLRSIQSYKSIKGIQIYAILEAFMFMGLVLLGAAGFIDFVGDSDFPGVVWQLPHVITILLALIMGQFFFATLLWPIVVLYGAVGVLDAIVFIWRAVSIYYVYKGTLPQYYLNQAFLRLWTPEFVVFLLMCIDVGQIIRLVSIHNHERTYQSDSDKKYFSALYRPKASKFFGAIQVIGVIDAGYTVFYFLIVSYYLAGFSIDNLVWIQSIHFVSWLMAIIAATTRNVKWIVPAAVVEIFALVFDGIVFGIYLWSLYDCGNGTAPQSCTNSQLEEFLLLFLTLGLIVIDALQNIFLFLILHVHRKFDVERSK